MDDVLGYSRLYERMRQIILYIPHGDEGSVTLHSGLRFWRVSGFQQRLTCHFGVFDAEFELHGY